MDRVSTAIADILERRAIRLWRKNCGVRVLSLESFAKNLNRICHCFKDCMEGLYKKNDPIRKETSVFTVCRIAQRCNIVATLFRNENTQATDIL